MPFLTIHVVEGRSDEDLSCLLDSIHAAVLDAFSVPERDRYQILHQHPASRFVVQDTGLGITRTSSRVLIEITSRPRTTEEKQAFYAGVCARLDAECGVAPSDVVVTVTENGDDDWSFGHGRAQFLTGEL